MKKLLVILSLILLAGCTNVPQPTPSATPDTTKKPNYCDAVEPCGETADMSGYEIEENHTFVEIDFKEATEKIINSDENAVYYFGFVGCPWCMEAVPVLSKVAIEKEVTVYYINTRSDYSKTDEGTDYRMQITDFLDDYLGYNENEGRNWLYVPDVLYMKNGEIMANHIGTSSDEHDATVRKMTDEEVGILTTIYSDYFDEFLK